MSAGTWTFRWTIFWISYSLKEFLQGLFPITSIINHACTANTICFATDGFRFTCRAVTDIKMGEELTTNYLHYHYHFYGLSYRSHELSQFWHFNCRCRRCRDMTEFGSLCDAVLCGDCEDGGCCPLNTSPGADWLCESCYSSQDAQVTRRLSITPGLNLDMRRMFKPRYFTGETCWTGQFTQT